VVIPAYQKPELLEQALQSVYSQSLRDYEVLVIDDCSEEEVVARYRLGDKTRLIKHPKRRGPAAARNSGLREAKGRFVAFLDMDDVWLPEKLESQVSILGDDQQAGMTFCHYISVDESLQAHRRQPFPRNVEGDCFTHLIRKNIVKSCSLVMLRRETLESCGFFDEEILGADDWDLWLRIAARRKVIPDPVPRVLYRVHGTQMSSNRLLMRKASVAVIEKLLACAEQEKHEVLRDVSRSLSWQLQRLSCEEASHNGFRAGLCVILRAIARNPVELRCYLRLLSLPYYGLARQICPTRE